MKGQLGISFQLIFAIIAGIAFLVFFFFLIRACTDAGSDRIDTLSTSAAVTRLRSMVYQGDTTANATLPESIVSCPGGTLTLRAENALNTLEKTPVFLSPEITGKVIIQTKQVVLGMESESPIPLGGVLYVLDENAQYLIVQDPAGDYKMITDLLPRTRNMKSLSALTVIDPSKWNIPSSAKSVIIVSVGNTVSLEGRALPSSPENFYGVNIRPQTEDWGLVAFYEREGNELREKGVVKYYTDFLAAGAAVSGRADNFKCGVDAFGDRMKTLTVLYERRAINLTSEDIPTYCRDSLGSAAGVLSGSNLFLNVGLDEYMTGFFNGAPTLMSHQLTLLDSSCPVIA